MEELTQEEIAKAIKEHEDYINSLEGKEYIIQGNKYTLKKRSMTLRNYQFVVTGNIQKLQNEFDGVDYGLILAMYFTPDKIKEFLNKVLNGDLTKIDYDSTDNDVIDELLYSTLQVFKDFFLYFKSGGTNTNK